MIWKIDDWWKNKHTGKCMRVSLVSRRPLTSFSLKPWVCRLVTNRSLQQISDHMAQESSRSGGIHECLPSGRLQLINHYLDFCQIPNYIFGIVNFAMFSFPFSFFCSSAEAADTADNVVELKSIHVGTWIYETTHLMPKCCTVTLTWFTLDVKWWCDVPPFKLFCAFTTFVSSPLLF